MIRHLNANRRYSKWATSNPVNFPRLWDGPCKAPLVTQVVTSEERRTLALKQKVAPETFAGQIGAKRDFRVTDHTPGLSIQFLADSCLKIVNSPKPSQP